MVQLARTKSVERLMSKVAGWKKYKRCLVGAALSKLMTSNELLDREPVGWP